MHDTELPSFRPLDRPPVRLADFVYDQLLEAIATGDVAPGVRLVQGTLADQMNVSRTPVREALLRLEREKILESVDRGGFVVRRPTAEEARQIYQVRQAIEGFAARLAAESPEPAAVAADLEPLVAATEEWSDDVREAFRRNDALHRGVVEATGNVVLVEAFDSVWARAQSFLLYAALLTISPDTHRPGSGHREIMEAIGVGDGLNAQEKMSAHIAMGLEDQLAALARQEG